MALEIILKCDHAMCGEAYDAKFTRLDETYLDLLREAQEKLDWTLEMDGLRVKRAYCKEHG